jgi:DNA repair ATPase RecN
MNTSFDIEHAEDLKLNLQTIRETLQSEWSAVTSAWQNLQGVWNDQQRDKFENAFEQILADYQTIEQATEKYTQQLSEQIQIVQKRNDRLNALNK